MAARRTGGSTVGEAGAREVKGEDGDALREEEVEAVGGVDARAAVSVAVDHAGEPRRLHPRLPPSASPPFRRGGSAAAEEAQHRRDEGGGDEEGSHLPCVTPLKDGSVVAAP
jgi:hypothetical protein